MLPTVHTNHHNDEYDEIYASMSMRNHTKDMQFLSSWLETTAKETDLQSQTTTSSTSSTSSSKSTTITDRLNHNNKSIDIYSKSFQVLHSTRHELSRQIGAHCNRLQMTDIQHSKSTSKLFNNIIKANKAMITRIYNLETTLAKTQLSHATETKKQNKQRTRLIARVTDSEIENDQLRAELKTALHMQKQATKEREKMAEMLEERLGGGTRGAGGGSDESSSAYLTALERSKRDISLLQTLGDVCLDFSSERTRRLELCNEMSSLVSRLGVAAGLDETRFDATAIFVDENNGNGAMGSLTGAIGLGNDGDGDASTSLMLGSNTSNMKSTSATTGKRKAVMQNVVLIIIDNYCIHCFNLFILSLIVVFFSNRSISNQHPDSLILTSL